MGFSIAHNDKEMVEAFEFYSKAFGAVKLAEFSPPGSSKENLYILIEIYGMKIPLPPAGSGEEII